MRLEREPLVENVLNRKQRMASATIVRPNRKGSGFKGTGVQHKFPIPDKAHARAAMARINQSDLTPAEKAKVMAVARAKLAEGTLLEVRRHGGGNPRHYPKGAPAGKGGEFAPKVGGGDAARLLGKLAKGAKLNGGDHVAVTRPDGNHVFGTVSGTFRGGDIELKADDGRKLRVKRAEITHRAAPRGKGKVRSKAPAKVMSPIAKIQAASEPAKPKKARANGSVAKSRALHALANAKHVMNPTRPGDRRAGSSYVVPWDDKAATDAIHEDLDALDAMPDADIKKIPAATRKKLAQVATDANFHTLSQRLEGDFKGAAKRKKLIADQAKQAAKATPKPKAPKKPETVEIPEDLRIKPGFRPFPGGSAGAKFVDELGIPRNQVGAIEMSDDNRDAYVLDHDGNVLAQARLMGPFAAELRAKLALSRLDEKPEAGRRRASLRTVAVQKPRGARNEPDIADKLRARLEAKRKAGKAPGVVRVPEPQSRRAAEVPPDPYGQPQPSKQHIQAMPEHRSADPLTKEQRTYEGYGASLTRPAPAHVRDIGAWERAAEQVQSKTGKKYDDWGPKEFAAATAIYKHTIRKAAEGGYGPGGAKPRRAFAAAVTGKPKAEPIPNAPVGSRRAEPIPNAPGTRPSQNAEMLGIGTGSRSDPFPDGYKHTLADLERLDREMSTTKDIYKWEKQLQAELTKTGLRRASRAAKNAGFEDLAEKLHLLGLPVRKPRGPVPVGPLPRRVGPRPPSVRSS